MPLQYCFYIFVIFFQKTSFFPLSASSTSNSITTAAVQLLSTQFPQCSVSFILLSNNTNTNSKFPSRPIIVFAKSSMPVGITNQSQIWLRSKYFAQKRNSCHLVVSAHGKQKEVTFTAAFQNLIQRHDDQDGIVMRDRDYFVFLSGSKEEAEYLLLSDLREKLRYKIAFFQQHNKGVNSIKVATVQPYVPISLQLKEQQKWGQLFVLNTLSEHTREKLFQDHTKNFYGYPMKMAVFSTLKPTYEVIPDKNRPGNVLAKRGFFANLTESIHTKLNMSVELFLCHGGEKFRDGTVSGILLESGKWIGCMGDVVNNRAHISIAAPVLNRFPYVDFLPKHKYDFIKFVSRQPRKNVSWMAFYKAFRPIIWIFVLIATILITVCFWIGSQIHDYRVDIHIGEIYYDQLRILLFQDVIYPSASIGITTRILFLLWLLCSLIIGTAYNSKLTSIMAIPNLEQGFPTNFKSLSNTPYFRIGASKPFLLGIGGVVFKRSKSPLMKNIYSRMEQDDNLEDCMKQALTSNYACVSWNFQHEFETGVAFADNRGVSPLLESTDMFNFIPLTQIVRKREVFRESYSYFLENAHQMGLNEKWASIDMLKLRLERIKSGKQFHRHNVEDKVKPLTCSNFLGSFIILVMGSIISGIIFCAELCRKISLVGFRKLAFFHKNRIRKSAINASMNSF